MRRLALFAGLNLALTASAALAHGDHGGAAGAAHQLGSPDHLGYATAAALAAAPLLAQRLYAMLRCNIGQRSRRRSGRKGVA